ncbi:MAG TPA: TRAP transporter small permease [Gammaproteobacteria bacterium]|jgi:TRAP-type C4-dicarboxylate transport system permease small subunit|nr:TRAP transporter small permease [Gammaproteobacteria bacterium]
MFASFTAWVNAHYEETGPVAWLALCLESIAALTLLFLMLLTCVDVFGRYVFSNSLNGATELTEVGLAILVFAEMPVVTWRGGHVVVDLLDNWLSHRVIQVLGLLSALLISSALYFIGVRAFQLAERSARRGEITEYLGMPTSYVVQYIAVMSWVTAALMISYGVYRTIRRAP